MTRILSGAFLRQGGLLVCGGLFGVGLVLGERLPDLLGHTFGIAAAMVPFVLAALTGAAKTTTA